PISLAVQRDDCMDTLEKLNPSDPKRREFLLSMGSSAAAAVITGCAPLHPDEPHPVVADRSHVQGAVPIMLRINGKDHHLRIDPRTTLLDCIRETVAFTGTKKGCDHGQCGACTVHVNGRRVNSCLSLALMHDGEEITTIEGLGAPGSLHPMPAAFLAYDGYQCGYCTSGPIMSAVALLTEPCGPAAAAREDLMKLNVETPARLLDINRLPLDKIEATRDGGLKIGATVRNSELANHPVVQRDYAVLSQALLAGASAQLRNMATTAGNLLQRTR